jgi:hypothetical protein
MLQEWNQCRGDRDNLRWGDVDVIHHIRRCQGEFVLVTAGNQLIHQLTLVVNGGVGLGDNKLALFDGRQVINIVGDLAVRDATIRRLQEAVLIGAGKSRQ